MPAALRKDRDLSLLEQEEICVSLVDGVPLKTICRERGLSLRQYYSFLNTYPDFAKKVENARVCWSHTFVDELMHVTDGCETMAEVQRAKVWSDNAKWVASKMVPEKYSDNLNLNINHSLDLSSVLLAAENRVLPILQAKASVVQSPSLPESPGVVEVVESSVDLSKVPAELEDLI